jgi:Domain of unknown function (DUF4419)
MPATESIASVTFAVDDVVPESSPLTTCKPLDAVRSLLNAPPTPFAADESSQGNPTHGRVEACWSYSLDCVAGIGHHPLIAAAHLAFSQHRPLVLSPDLIWVTIVQGLAQHVRLSPEKYRDLLVRHEGTRRVTVERDDLHHGSPENPWAAVVGDFVALIRREIGEPIDRFACDFSTTGPVERTVSEIALLDVLQPYFSYNVVGVCGIPSITLEGTPADWRKLREKVELLAPFDLEWWLCELRLICDQFARAAAGDIDREHWCRLYKIRAVYALKVINGWLGHLFPYTKNFENGTYSCRNVLLDPAVQAEIQKLEVEDKQVGRQQRMRFDAPGITAESLPRGLSQVPFTLSDTHGKRAMELIAGPIVVTQAEETGALRPTLGWAVSESPPIEQALLRLSEHKFEPARNAPSSESLRAIGYYVPTDVLRFYRQLDSGLILGKNGSPLYRILPLSEWSEPEWGQTETTRGGKTIKVSDDLFQFAELPDGTELVIRLYCPEGMNTGAVFVGRQRDGSPPPETGRKIARSFTDFLRRALDGGSEPYFRRADFTALP